MLLRGSVCAIISRLETFPLLLISFRHASSHVHCMGIGGIVSAQLLLIEKESLTLCQSTLLLDGAQPEDSVCNLRELTIDLCLMLRSYISGLLPSTVSLHTSLNRFRRWRPRSQTALHRRSLCSHHIPRSGVRFREIPAAYRATGEEPWHGGESSLRAIKSVGQLLL